MRPARWPAIALLALSAHAQTPPTFEAASIRRNVSGEINTQIKLAGNRLTITNASVKTLIRNAWDLLGFQLAGGPPWLDSDMYDISATTGRSEELTTDQFREMLKTLLAERFALRVHWDEREGPVYALVVAKEGSKLKENSGTVEPGINTRKAPHAARMQGTREPTSILASNLGNQLGRFVNDKTGLTGSYDWLLEWDPDPNPDSTLPSLVTAVQQLGLRLESQKGPTHILIIDALEKASDN
jgi:uncharacterized protein (TIGR03435 family)